MISTKRLFRKPARVTEVPETPSTKERLVMPRAIPTDTPFLMIVRFIPFSLRITNSPMMSVAREKRSVRNVSGGISRNAILLATKLPPQKKVVTTIQRTARRWMGEDCIVAFAMGY